MNQQDDLFQDNELPAKEIPISQIQTLFSASLEVETVSEVYNNCTGEIVIRTGIFRWEDNTHRNRRERSTMAWSPKHGGCLLVGTESKPYQNSLNEGDFPTLESARVWLVEFQKRGYLILPSQQEKE